MSKLDNIARSFLIIKKLKSKPYSSYDELQRFIENQYEYSVLKKDTSNINFSPHILQTDITDIRDIFGIDILYSSSLKGYYTLNGYNLNIFESLKFQC